MLDVTYAGLGYGTAVPTSYLSTYARLDIKGSSTVQTVQMFKLKAMVHMKVKISSAQPSA
jgi:hypothetical protein